MTRYATLLLVSVLAACSGSEPGTPTDSTLSISLFTAAPSTLAKGSATTLVFAVNNAEKVRIEPGIGDVTDKTQVQISPTETTTYTLTATKGSQTASKELTITVGPTPTTGFKLAVTGALTAGGLSTLTVTAVDAAGATVPTYAGTVHLVSNDPKAELPAEFTFTAADQGVKTVPVTFRTAGPRLLIASGTVGGGMQGSFSTTSEALAVKAGAAAELRLGGLVSEAEAGQEVTLQVSFADAFGNVAEHAGLLRVTLSDVTAPVIPDVAVSNGGASAKAVFFKSGVQTVTVQAINNAALKATAEVRVQPSTAASFVLSTLPASVRAGESLALSVTALDSRGNRALRYAGRVHFSATDASAQLPADASFDQGVASVSVAFRRTGEHTLTASLVGGGLSVTSVPVNVRAAEARGLELSGLPAEVEPGTALALQVSVADAYGNRATEHTGTLRVTLSDAAAPAIPDVAVRNGIATINASFIRTGLQTVSVQDTSNAALKGSAEVRVKPGAAVSYALSALPGSARAGEALALTVTAFDSKGNRALGYSGRVHFSSTDASAQLPADAAFIQGVASVSASFRGVGEHTLTASEVDGRLTATTGAVSVRAAAARVLRLSGLPAETEPGTELAFQASLFDAYGNAASEHTGALRFTLSDTTAPVIPDAVVNNGTASARATFFKAGLQTVTVQDPGNSALKASAEVQVKPGAAVSYVLSALPASARAGEALALTVTALDSKGNRVVGSSGRVHFSSTDASAQLPADTAFNQGVASVSVAFRGAGDHTVTASEVAGSLTATTGSVAVKAAAAKELRLSGLPAETEPGTELMLQASLVDAYGNPASEHTGALRFTLSDTTAPAIPDVAVSNGSASARVSFVKAGLQTVTVQDPGNAALRASAEVQVKPGAAVSYVLSALPGAARAGEPLALTVTALDSRGNRAQGYAGRVHFSSTDASAQLPADAAFNEGVASVSVSFRGAGNHSVTASEVNGSLTASTGSVSVKAAAAAMVHLSGLPAETESGTELSLQAAFVDAYGNAAEHTGSLRISLSDASAPVIPDAAVSSGAVTFKVSFFQTGLQTVTVQDTGNAALKASAEVRVKPGVAVSYALSALPASARAGEGLGLTVTALDSKGNRALGYAGRVHLSSTDASAQLPADTAFNQGVAYVSVAFRGVGNHTVTASEVDGGLTATTGSVSVSAAAVARIVLSGAGPTTAGTGTAFTATVKDLYGNTVTGYQGTVHFTSTDAMAELPADYTFTAGDSGVHPFTATFKRAGSQTLTVTDGAAAVMGSSAFDVSAADAASCELPDAPASTPAGTTLPVRVVMRDAFGNLATAYSGTVTVTSNDINPAAVMPEPAAFVPAQDRGSRLFSVKLVSSGTRTVTASDTSGLSCQTDVVITPAAARLVLALTPDANAGSPVSATVMARDTFGNDLTSYTGSVSFSSTDGAAVLPGPVTFTAADAGTVVVGVTFNTLGAQQLTAAQVDDASVTGTGSTSVHGLLYTNPAPGYGKVRVVVNAASSSASVVQLDLVANVSLVASGTVATARGGIYSAGMNLPVDTSRVTADSTLLVEGNTLNLGAAPKAVAASLPVSGATAGVLYTGVSQKFSGAGAVLGDTTVSPGRILYSVRLKLANTAIPGTVFDGASLGTKFRAAVRNRAGDEVLSNADFAIGKLEVR